jgi:hypothetical protein
MLTPDKCKNYAFIVLTALILILLFLLQNKENKLAPLKVAQEDYANIIVDSKTFSLLDDFRTILKQNNVTGLTIGFKNGEIALLTADGQFINPCINNDKNSVTQRITQNEYQPCRFESSLTETHTFLARSAQSGSDCNTSCQAKDGSGNHVCTRDGANGGHKNSYGCHTYRGNCEHACPKPQ